MWLSKLKRGSQWCSQNSQDCHENWKLEGSLIQVTMKGLLSTLRCVFLRGGIGQDVCRSSRSGSSSNEGSKKKQGFQRKPLVVGSRSCLFFRHCAIVQMRASDTNCQQVTHPSFNVICPSVPMMVCDIRDIRNCMSVLSAVPRT